MFILRVNLGMWPSNWLFWKNEPCSEGFNTHLCGFQGDRWQNVHFESKPRHVTLKLIVLENQALFWGFQHTFMGFQGDRSENVYFEGKPRHVTPQINLLGKMSPVLRVSTHIYGDSKEIDGKTIILRANLGMWWPQIDWAWPCSEHSNTHLWDFQGDRWENVHFHGKPRHVTPQIDLAGKMSPVLRVSTHIYGDFQGDRWENVHFWK